MANVVPLQVSNAEYSVASQVATAAYTLSGKMLVWDMTTSVSLTQSFDMSETFDMSTEDENFWLRELFDAGALGVVRQHQIFPVTVR